MALPFTVEQVYGVFRDYNTAVWPAQWLLVAMALAAVAAVLRPRPWSGVAVSAILGVLWAWIAAAFLLGVQPDLGLIAAAVAGMGLLATPGQRHRALKP